MFSTGSSVQIRFQHYTGFRSIMQFCRAAYAAVELALIPFFRARE